MFILIVCGFIGILHTAIGKSTNYIFFLTKLPEIFSHYIYYFNKIFMIFKPELYQNYINYILKSNSQITTNIEQIKIKMQYQCMFMNNICCIKIRVNINL